MRYNNLNRSENCKNMNGVKVLKVWSSKDVSVIPTRNGVRLMKGDTAIATEIYVEDGLVDHTSSPVEGGSFENKVKVVVKGVSNMYGKQLIHMMCQRWIVQYEDYNGIEWVVGDDVSPMKLEYSYKNSGGTAGERDYTLTFRNRGLTEAQPIEE